MSQLQCSLVLHGTSFIRSLLQLHGMATHLVKLFLGTSSSWSCQTGLSKCSVAEQRTLTFSAKCVNTPPSQTDTCSSVTVAINILETAGSNPDIPVEICCAVFSFSPSAPPPFWGTPEAMTRDSPLHASLLRPTIPSLTT